MWLYVKEKSQGINLDNGLEIFVLNNQLKCSAKPEFVWILKEYQNEDYAKQELNKIISSLAENKKVYIID